ncbi:hypothetical protein DL96DRAFT_233644 [Flagelloscypha sp. PMI_526]|nr:hypothetical protein DL96DRAFT_233644 [Flagelloscypha sp. PMI_526]
MYIATSISLLRNAFTFSRIENVLFRLPESILAKNSLFFEDLFLLPQPDGQESSDDNPTLVPDTSPEVFTKFCRWMFHLVSSDSLVAETDERIWMALLRFAHKFQIKRLFEDIISTIQKENTSADVNLSVSDVQRLNIWALFDLPIDWVTEPFLRICNRDERISDDEMLHLDLICSTNNIRPARL